MHFVALCLLAVLAVSDEDDEDGPLTAEQEKAVKTLEAMAAEANQLRTDPQVRLGVASAAICFFDAMRPKLVSEVRTEQKYAKELGGVQDNAKLLAIQKMVRNADEGKAAAVAELSRLKKKRAPCTDKNVKRLVLCFADSYQDGSLDEPDCKNMNMPVAIAWELVPQLKSPFPSRL